MLIPKPFVTTTFCLFPRMKWTVFPAHLIMPPSQIVFQNEHNGSAYFWLLVIQSSLQRCSDMTASLPLPLDRGETGWSGLELLAGWDISRAGRSNSVS